MKVRALSATGQMPLPERNARRDWFYAVDPDPDTPKLPKLALPTARHDHQADGIMSWSPPTASIDSVHRETTPTSQHGDYHVHAEGWR
ncbi:hypothetical protein BN1708_003475 [Verticillium longisporum]|uniref:Uncharacterized protein n=1 Tax=Verticillium longisporum TaxID=100787 RepID=A0A0G4LIZ7_VERLO|nr:hypothetical protein BN1708_003475 [Verticillium longisporum]